MSAVRLAPDRCALPLRHMQEQQQEDKKEGAPAQSYALKPGELGELCNGAGAQSAGALDGEHRVRDFPHFLPF